MGSLILAGRGGSVPGPLGWLGHHQAAGTGVQHRRPLPRWPCRPAPCGHN